MNRRFDVFAQIDDASNRSGVDSVDDDAGEVRGARDHHFALGDGRRPEHPADGANALEGGLVVAPGGLARRVDDDVRIVSENLRLQIGAEATHHADRARKREGGERNREYRETADEREKAALLCAHVTRGYVGNEGAPLEPIEDPGN